MNSCEQILAMLDGLNADVICAIPGAPPEWQTRFVNLEIYPHALDVTSILTDADLVVTSGAGTIATALLSGVPVLLLPQVVEQYFAGLALEKTGAGFVLHDPTATDQCCRLLTTLLAVAQYKRAAAQFMQRNSRPQVDEANALLVGSLLERLSALP